MNVIIKRLLYAGLERSEFHVLASQARQENEGKLKTYALVSLILFASLAVACLVTGLFPVASVISYAVMAAFSAAVYALARALPARRPAAVTGLCYCFIAALYAFSLVNSAMHPDMPAVAAIAVMLMGPFLFSERPAHLIAMNLATIVALCVMSFQIKSRQLALVDLWNSVAFGAISIAAEITAESLRFQLLAQSERVRYLSETDVMTGCKNRNSYIESLSRLPGLCRERLVCVYVDVNGLHNLNDSQGHEAGDRMLQAVARALLDAFDARDVYRTGGDEFVVFCPDGSPEEIGVRVAGVDARLAAEGYDISSGVEAGEKAGLDVDALVKRAEMRMYEEKEAYYRQAGHDRRKR